VNVEKIEIFWARKGGYEGWMYRVTMDDGSKEIGPMTDFEASLPDRASNTELEEAVQAIGYHHGEEIESGAVAIVNSGGGYAVWTR
jgi:hypothetical protein